MRNPSGTSVVVGANGVGIQGKGFGDRRTETLAQVSVNLDPASIISPTEVFSSLGIAQVKWVPASALNLISGNPHPGTEPLRWKSTAFNIDYEASILRYYYDGLCSWCNSTYQSRFVATKTRTAANGWEVIGAWEGTPEPWNGTPRSNA